MSQHNESSPKRPKDAGQYGLIEARVTRDRSLPRNVRTVYHYLAVFADAETRESKPSQARMAEELDLSAASITEAVKLGAAVGLWTAASWRVTTLKIGVPSSSSATWRSGASFTSEPMRRLRWRQSGGCSTW